jgi:hypothetical protein
MMAGRCILPEAAMPSLSRFTSRLRQQALHWYEILLCATLLALALSAAALPLGQEGGDGSVQCGNIQSSTVVMQR